MPDDKPDDKPEDEPEDEPGRVLNSRLAAHNAANMDDDDLALNAYRKDVLVLPTELLTRTPGLVQELNDLLQPLHPERPFSENVTIDSASAVTAIPLRPGVDARKLRADAIAALGDSAAGRSPAVAEAVRQLAHDRLLESGAPVVPEPPDPFEPVKAAAGTKQGHGDAGRVPVKIFAAAPRWRRLPARRPVVALVDTPVDDSHDWLSPSKHDPFCVDAETLGWPPPKQRQTGDAYAGHGTFLAGLVRQVAPDVGVLSVAIMDDDGVVYASDTLNALDWLLSGLAEGKSSRRFDVLCIAFGYVPKEGDEGHNAKLKACLKGIAEHGVHVVASAGNRGSSIKTYPAAFAAEPDIPLISVGAQNPDRKHAHYSNHGDWVTDWEIGTGVISTMPRRLNGRLPRPVVPASDPLVNPNGYALDPDDFIGGFARWSGTSFAAAVVAGRLAQGMVDAHWVGEP